MSVLKGITPNPAQLASAYREVFDSVIETAGGKDGRISVASAERLAERGDAGKLVADNILNYLDKTGQKSVGVSKFQGVVADYVERQAERHAGPNQRLSLVEIRNLPTDLVDDVMHLRGRDNLSVTPAIVFDENGVYEYISEKFKNPEQSVQQGQVTHDGSQVVISGLNDVGPYQEVAEKLLTKMWDKSFQHRVFNGAPIELGPRGNGELQFGPIIDAASGKEGIIAHWKDLDDDSFAWFFEAKDNGGFEERHEVYLN